MGVRVELATGFLPGRLASLLSSIHSAPNLSSVTFSFADRSATPSVFPSSGNWVVADKWLAWVATVRTTAKASLMVVLAGWPEDNPNWEGYFPEFGRAGGILRREIHDHEYWDPRMLFVAERWRDGL